MDLCWYLYFKYCVYFLIRASIDLGLVGIVLLEFVVPYGMAELIVYLKKRGQNYELHGN